ncbi:MAG: KH domain-containing protein [Cyanobacteria bacterium]|nr:KH domain-containing protein [Cyanobacteriota bacterium]MDW8199879.1 KH domain-containing protein [Cyanobacteriota bacterium SKYGB_h_bin112]
MSSSNSVPPAANAEANLPTSLSSNSPCQPDYKGLVKFLIEPFLDSPESLRIDCETSPSRPRVWIRVAFADSDRGRVFGRGGRNIQAIRVVLDAVAKLAGQTASLDIHGEHQGGDREHDGKSRQGRPRPRRSSSDKPSPKSGGPK